MKELYTILFLLNIPILILLLREQIKPKEDSSLSDDESTHVSQSHQASADVLGNTGRNQLVTREPEDAGANPSYATLLETRAVRLVPLLSKSDEGNLVLKTAVLARVQENNQEQDSPLEMNKTTMLLFENL